MKRQNDTLIIPTDVIVTRRAQSARWLDQDTVGTTDTPLDDNWGHYDTS